MFGVTFDDFKSDVSKHEAEILAGLGIACAIKAVVDAVKVTISATREVDSIRMQRAKDEDVEIEEIHLEKKEVAKIVAKKAIVPAAEMILSAAFICCGVYLKVKQVRSLAFAYAALEETRQYEKAATEEIVGKNKAKKIEDRAEVMKAEAHPFDEMNVVNTGVGSSLFYLPLTDTWFICDAQAIEHGINRAQWRMNNSEFCLSANEVFGEIGRGLDRAEAGRILGYNSDDQLRVEYIPAKTEFDRPYNVVRITPDPHENFMDIYTTKS